MTQENKFSWHWSIKELETVEKHGHSVFSCFACGGGSTMGYKRAGYTVIGCNDIDPKMNKIYVHNHKPKYNYLMDIRKFKELEDLPEELYNLDILDGSPPCTTFSTAGNREKDWGKERVYAEGAAIQTLDDLFFHFIDVAEKLQPKIVVAENVTGLIKGNAKGYVAQIIKQFNSIGYEVQLFKLNAAYMDVPQKRERVFFIANRMGYPKLKLEFNHKPILFGEVRSEYGGKYPCPSIKKMLDIATEQDFCVADVRKRLKLSESFFSNRIIWDNRVADTITTLTHNHLRGYDKCEFSNEDIVHCQSFPYDYDFLSDSPHNVAYVCGMSVPPNMTANIASEIYSQWLRG